MYLIIMSFMGGIIGFVLGALMGADDASVLFAFIGFFIPSINVLDKLYKEYNKSLRNDSINSNQNEVKL